MKHRPITPLSAEDRAIQQWTGHWPRIALPVGPGDDCAVTSPAPRGHLPVLKADAVVEGVHFLPSHSGRAVGHKALARALSDFAAMGAIPAHALITVGAPPGAAAPRRIEAAYRGMASLARQWRVALAGGETTRSPVLWINVALHGWVDPKKLVRRGTASAGDLIYVTGKLGGSQPRRHLTFTPRLSEGQWLAGNQLATAMMDLSDGLGADLPRLARASNLSFQLDPADLPLHRGANAQAAVSEGEDYELLFTVSPTVEARLLRSWPFQPAPTRIGVMLPGGQSSVTGGPRMTGYDHFE